MNEVQLRDGNFHELDELLDSIEDCTVPETLQEADNRFLERVRQEVAAKSGRLRNAIKYYQQQADDAAKIAQQAKARVERIKSYVLSEMVAAGIREIKAPWGFLRRQPNGGIAPLVIEDEAQVPGQYKTVTVTMPLHLWLRIAVADEGVKCSDPAVSNTAVREALERPCPTCDGFLQTDVTCATCGNTRKNQVPGARLSERGEHLRIG